MSTRIASTRDPSDIDGAWLVDSVSGWSCSPRFEDANAAQDFCDWLGVDWRKLTEAELRDAHSVWIGSVKLGCERITAGAGRRLRENRPTSNGLPREDELTHGGAR